MENLYVCIYIFYFDTFDKYFSHQYVTRFKLKHVFHGDDEAFTIFNDDILIVHIHIIHIGYSQL